MATTQSTPASTYPQWFQRLFEREVIHKYQQMSTKLREAVRVKNASQGESVRFNLLAPFATPGDKARGGRVKISNPAHSTVTVTMEDKYLAATINPLDDLRNNINTKVDYQQSMAASMARQVDTFILDELNTNGPAFTTATTVPAAGLSNVKFFTDLIKEFDAAEVPDEDRYLIVPPKFVADALNLDKLTSIDYMNLKTILDGDIQSVFGFKWIKSTLLGSNGATAAAAGKRAYALNKNAVGLAILKEPSIRIDYAPELMEDLIAGSMSMGCKIIQAEGVKTINVVGA